GPVVALAVTGQDELLLHARQCTQLAVAGCDSSLSWRHSWKVGLAGSMRILAVKVSVGLELAVRVTSSVSVWPGASGRVVLVSPTRVGPSKTPASTPAGRLLSPWFCTDTCATTGLEQSTARLTTASGASKIPLSCTFCRKLSSHGT